MRVRCRVLERRRQSLGTSAASASEPLCNSARRPPGTCGGKLVGRGSKASSRRGVHQHGRQIEEVDAVIVPHLTTQAATRAVKPLPSIPGGSRPLWTSSFREPGGKVLDLQFEKRLVPIMDFPCLVADLEYV